MTNQAKNKTTVDPEEIAQFSAQADLWWDESGPFKPLHKLNPARLTYIRQQICTHFDHDDEATNSLKGLDILDIGCGGGLVTEPISRMGAKVTGIDASEKNIMIASLHAEKMGIKKTALSYKFTSAEDLLAKSKKKYDVVLALEIVEHVSDVAFFIETCSKLIKPNGLIIFSTLNRTPRSFALGIVAAEYILRWLPKGTHSWKKFLRPSELAEHAEKSNLAPQDITGLVYNPLSDSFSLSKKDIAVNYFMTATKE